MQVVEGERAAAAGARTRRAARDRGAVRRGGHGLRRARGLGLGPARARPLCRLSAAERARAPDRADPSRRGAAHPRLSGSDRSSCRRAWRCRSARGSTIVEQEGDFAVTADGLYLWARHLGRGRRRASPTSSRSPSAFSRRPISGAGGRPRGSTAPAWCRPALTAAGIAAPRDSDMQEAALGEPVALEAPPLAARRSRVLEGPCRRHARRGDAAARQRLAHEGGERAARRGARPDRRKRRRGGDERERLDSGA